MATRRAKKTAPAEYSMERTSMNASKNSQANWTNTAQTMVRESNDAPYSLQNMVRFLLNNAGLIFLAAAVFIVGFMSGSLWTENQVLKKNLANAGTGTTTTAQGTGTQQAQQPPQVNVTMDQIKALFADAGKIKFGDPNSKVLFVELSDPSCPYCHAAAGKDSALNNAMGAQFKLVTDGGTYDAPVEEMRKLVDQGKAAFVWIYAQGHGNGEMGTKALYCANEKGKFWQVHDLLMSDKGYEILNGTTPTGTPTTGPIVKNDKTKSGDLAEFLKSAIDPSFMKSCLDSGKYDGKLTEDQTTSNNLGFQGTPDFFVNTKNFAGAYNYTDIKPTVDAELAK